MTTLTTYRPSLLGHGVFNDIFDTMLDFPQLMHRTTQGYPVADIYREEDGNTVMEFALAGFSRAELAVEIKPEKNSITVSANTDGLTEKERQRVRAVLKAVGGEKSFDVLARVDGGGYSAQADAISLGIARALLIQNPENEPILREGKFLTRDSREVERKKPGQKGARKSFQFSKR